MSNFQYVNYSKGFINAETISKNLLITTLGVFNDTQLSDSPTCQLDILTENAQRVAESINRYGAEWSTTIKPQVSTHAITIPWFGTSDRVTPADFQGMRKFNSANTKESVDQLISDKFIAMYRKFLITRERYFIDSLLKNSVSVPFTPDAPALNWEAEWGYTQRTGQLNTDVSVDPMESIDIAVSETKRLMGSLVQNLDGFILLAGSSLYRRIKYHPQTSWNIKADVLSAKDILWHPDILPGFGSFKIGNVRIVEVNDADFYGVGTDEAFLFPVFSGASSDIALPYTNIIGPASRHMELARGNEILPFYAYSTEDEFKCKNLYSEYSFLPVCFRPDLVVKLERYEEPGKTKAKA